MNLSESDRALVVVITQCANLIGGGMLLMSASILYAALLMITDPKPAMILPAMINAAFFYVWSLKRVSDVFITWKLVARKVAVERAGQA